MTDSSTFPSPPSGSGANTTASDPAGAATRSTVGTAPSIPDSGPGGSDHDGMVDLDDSIDDPTLAYRAQIIAAVARIDEALPGTTTRELISGDEVQSLLLDLRLLLA